METETHGRMVSVFGGSQCRPDSPECREAFQIGRRLAEAGYTVCTGGYQGTMAAASRGAYESGGGVVGITMSQLTSPINEYVTHIRPTTDFYGRLQGLIKDSDAFIAVRGGIGTLVEVTLVWNKLTTRVLSPRPLILVGREVWLPWLEACQATLAIGPDLIDHLQVVDSAAEAVAAIVNAQPLATVGAEA
jgi:uncharacterized protein (TIGR00730 family)